MALPHFTSIRTIGGSGDPNSGPRPQEPVYLGLFEISFVLPVLLQQRYPDTSILTFQATSIALDLTKAIAVGEQKFKFTKRKFLTTPEDTSASFTIKFNVNVDDRNAMSPWTILKAWYDLVWNSQTGFTHYKSDIIGTIIVNQHDKKGVVLRRVTYRNCQLKDISSVELAWGEATLYEATANFEADYWDDEYYDLPPVTTGAPEPSAGGSFQVPGYATYPGPFSGGEFFNI